MLVKLSENIFGVTMVCEQCLTFNKNILNFRVIFMNSCFFDVMDPPRLFFSSSLYQCMLNCQKICLRVTLICEEYLTFAKNMLKCQKIKFKFCVVILYDSNT